MKTLIFDSYYDFLNRPNKKVNGVSVEFSQSNKAYVDSNSSNEGCWNCVDCQDCQDCYNCVDCRNCVNCIGCYDFKNNPQRIISPILGSRKKQTIYYWNTEKDLIVCGCFTGTLLDFKSRVVQEYGKEGHGVDYLKWINSVEIYINSL